MAGYESGRLSIIIVNYNTRNFLQGCLSSIYAQNKQSPPEVVVVDNASSDGSVEMIREQFPRVVLIANDTNRGFAAANNQGIKYSTGSLVLLLNPDTVVCDGTLEAMAAALESDPKIGAVGCKILNPDMSLQPSCRNFPSLATVFLEQTNLRILLRVISPFRRRYLNFWDHDSPREVDWLIGACIMIKRECLDDVGLLDESFFMYAEDVDLCYRMQRRRWKVYFTPCASVIHYGGQSSKPHEVEMFIEQLTSDINWFQKHRGPLQAKIARILFLLGISLRIVYCTTVGCVTPTSLLKAYRAFYTRAFKPYLTRMFLAKMGR